MQKSTATLNLITITQVFSFTMQQDIAVNIVIWIAIIEIFWYAENIQYCQYMHTA